MSENTEIKNDVEEENSTKPASNDETTKADQTCESPSTKLESNDSEVTKSEFLI